MPLYNLFPRPASRDISPRAPVLNKAPVLNTAPIFNPFPGMQSHQQASEQSSSEGLTAHVPAHDPLNALQSMSQPASSQAMQQSGNQIMQQNGAAPAAFGSTFKPPQASMGLFNAGACIRAAMMQICAAGVLLLHVWEHIRKVHLHATRHIHACILLVDFKRSHRSCCRCFTAARGLRTIHHVCRGPTRFQH